MSKDKQAPLRPTPRALGLLVLLGLTSGLWALFQWTQLVAARTGGSSFCSLGDSTACVDIWDSAFATAIQEWTGVPIAGWGLVWSLAATALPLWALVGRAEGDSKGEAKEKGDGQEEKAEPSSAWVATVWISLAGVVAVLGLIAASLAYGALCTTCAVTYTLVAAYVAVCFVQTPPTAVPLARGISPAAAAVAAAYVLLFIPGLQTPMSQAAESRKALLQITGEQVAERRVDEPSRPAPGSPRAGDPGEPATAEDPIERLATMLAQLPPQVKQLFADELLRYKTSEAVPLRDPRSLVGPANAPVRITEWTDTLCGHCAGLHDTLAQLRSALPPDSFAVEARHFPLDSTCNAEITSDPAHPVRCLAAQAKICLEGKEGAFDYANRLYVRQSGLTDEDVYSQAEPWMSRDELATCVASDATSAKLADDVAWAAENEIEGTPMVLLNGKRVAPFGPLLFALVLTEGDATHPAFAGLPEGVLRDPHAGHAH